jgi:D-arabinose 1-dehydrogenase-like Zn-dependent alcohol dehydrogenase
MAEAYALDGVGKTYERVAAGKVRFRAVVPV